MKHGAKNTIAVIWKLLHTVYHQKKPEMSDQHKNLEFDYIVDGIYIGTNQCCETHFNEELLKEGISADISLEEERLDAPFGVEFYVWMAVKDHTPPSPDQIDFGVAALQKLEALGRKIYVHCKNGHGRANTLVAAYLIRKGKTPEEAEAFVKKQRPVTHLRDVQREALRKFAQKQLP